MTPAGKALLEPRMYKPEDRSMLGEPPWKPSDAALIAWEEAHGHDVRLDCDVYTPCHVAIADLERRAEAAAPLRAALEEIQETFHSENLRPGAAVFQMAAIADQALAASPPAATEEEP